MSPKSLLNKPYKLVLSSFLYLPINHPLKCIFFYLAFFNSLPQRYYKTKPLKNYSVAVRERLMLLKKVCIKYNVRYVYVKYVVLLFL